MVRSRNKTEISQWRAEWDTDRTGEEEPGKDEPLRLTSDHGLPSPQFCGFR